MTQYILYYQYSGQNQHTHNSDKHTENTPTLI